MAKLIVVTLEGDEHEIESGSGATVMEIIRDAGIDEMLAICGGNCSCASCHVHVQPGFEDKLPAVSDDENELLDGSPDRDDTSRLACQLPFDESLDGLKVYIAKEI